MSAESRRLAAVMFTDVVATLLSRSGTKGFALALLREQNALVLPLVKQFGGTPIKTIGDAHLVEFGSALAAVQCAVEIQRRARELARSSTPDKTFKLRIGVHVGDVVHKEGDVFGDAVNIASRIEPLAEEGGVCVSQQVYDQVSNKVTGLKLERLPLKQLKNVSMRIEVYRVIDSAMPGVEVEEALPKERIAVLPLSNFSPNPQHEYPADGMTDELITAISGVQGLRVIARTSVMRFKNSSESIVDIGRKLRVGTVLEGSFRKAGERIRVTVQLIEASSEEHLWASNYDGNMQDIFSIQSDIASKVAPCEIVLRLGQRYWTLPSITSTSVVFRQQVLTKL